MRQVPRDDMSVLLLCCWHIDASMASNSKFSSFLLAGGGREFTPELASAVVEG